MSAPTLQTEIAFSELDSIIADNELLNAPRAVLLLRVCQITQLFRPDLLPRYWQQLLKLNSHLPGEHREAYEGLRVVIESVAAGPDKVTSLGKFAREIVDLVNEAVEKAVSDPEAAAAMFSECEKRLRDRWWPFGKRAAWTALVAAWAGIDRKDPLRLLKKLPRGAQRVLVNRLNEQSPLSEEEWDLAHKNMSGGAVPIIIEVLDKPKPLLKISKQLADSVSVRLISEAHATSGNPDEKRKIDARRIQGLERYLTLVNCMTEDATQAEALMERLFRASAKTSCFGEQWLDRFTMLKLILISWSAHVELRAGAENFLSAFSDSTIRDFALAQWLAMTANSEAENSLKAIGEKCADKLPSQAWFLVTLIRRGLCEEAMRLAQSSPEAKDLLPIIRRAWLCERPETAAAAISAEELKDDLVGQFLLADSTEKRVEFLREHTTYGMARLPQALWARPGFEMSFILDGGLSADSGNKACPRWFSKKQSPKRQFRDYVRLHGYGQYCYEDVDPLLLETLIAWAGRHPGEVDSLMQIMWDTMKPQQWDLMADLIRNSTFERCQNVLSASPKLFDKLFVAWVKLELVDNHIERVEGGAIYSFSLNEIVPFLYCLLGAQKVARSSPERCDELLKIALAKYTASEDLMTAAAEIYASDKGLKALKWIIPEKNRSKFLEQWQMGIIQSSTREITAMILESATLESAAGPATQVAIS